MGLFDKIVRFMTDDGSKPLPPKIGRNEPCWCGSGKKYKKCCFDRDERIRYEASCKCSGST